MGMGGERMNEDNSYINYLYTFWEKKNKLVKGF